MTNHDQERLDCLIKRRDWLKQRVAQRRANGVDASLDDAERSALDWAIGIIGRHFEQETGKVERW